MESTMAIDFQSAIAAGSSGQDLQAQLTMHTADFEVLYAWWAERVEYLASVPLVVFPPVFQAPHRPTASVPTPGLTTRPRKPEVGLFNFKYLHGLPVGAAQPFAWDQASSLDISLFAPSFSFWTRSADVHLQLDLYDNFQNIVSQATIGLQETGTLLHGIGSNIFRLSAPAAYTVTLDLLPN
jgi:hypothetical protein